MANITFPEQIARRIARFDMAHRPAAVTTTTVTGHRRSARFGPGLWVGSIAVAPARGAVAAVVEAFISEFDGPLNVTELPLRAGFAPASEALPVAPTVPGGARVESVTPAGGLLLTHLTVDVDASPGQHLRIGNRLFRISRVDGRRAFQLLPQWGGVVGMAVRPGTTVRCGLRNASPVSGPRVDDYYGPWTWAWTETP